jgi:hypothetical protein
MTDSVVRVTLRPGAVTWRHIDTETVLLDLRASEYLTINGSGSLLWSELAAGTTRALLIQRLLTAYGISETQAAADIDAFLASCDERGYLEKST